MHVRNLYLLFAREVLVDASDNMNSIVKIIEKFNATTNLPKAEWEKMRATQEGKSTIPIAYSIASSWLFDKKLTDDSFITLRLETFDPAGVKLTTMDQEHVAPKGINKANLNVNVQGLPITVPGDYVLQASLLSKSKKILATAEYPYNVELAWSDQPAK